MRYMVILLLFVLTNHVHASVDSQKDVLTIGGFNKNPSNEKNSQLLLKRIISFLQHQEPLSKYSFKNITKTFIANSPSKEQKMSLLKALRDHSSVSTWDELSQYLELNSLTDAQQLKAPASKNKENINNIYSVIKSIFDYWIINKKIDPKLVELIVKNENFVSSFNTKFFSSYSHLQYQSFWLLLYDSLIPKMMSSPDIVFTYIGLLNSNLKYKKTVDFYQEHISKNVDFYKTKKYLINTESVFLKISQAFSHLSKYNEAREILKILPTDADENYKKTVQLETLNILIKENLSFDKNTFEKSIAFFDDDSKNYALLFLANYHLSKSELDLCQKTIDRVSNSNGPDLSLWRNLKLLQCSRNESLKIRQDLIHSIESNYKETNNFTEEYDFWRLFVILTAQFYLKSDIKKQFITSIKQKDLSSTNYGLAIEIIEDLEKGLTSTQKLEQLGLLLGDKHSVYIEIKNLLKQQSIK
jgi:hypothetical protein